MTTKKFKVIQIDNYGIVVDDSEIKNGDFIYFGEKGGDTQFVEKVIGFTGNTHIKIKSSDNEYGYGDWNKCYCKKAIASIGKRLDGVPLIELAKKGDAKDFLIKEYKHAKDVNNFGESAQLLSYNQVCRLMEDYAGYKANTNKYSEEDMKTAFEGELFGKSPKNNPYGKSFEEFANNFIQSLQKQSIPTEVELTKEYLSNKGEWKDVLLPSEWESTTQTRIKITNKETNSITPISYKYE